uniref:uncharacterized protein LOC120334224 n=1 Tax=Styela clava TaxID=7725 RepID=UPI0019399656|nr:uncharacterized protein LOC120334224 [Styela clava]
MMREISANKKSGRRRCRSSPRNSFGEIQPGIVNRMKDVYMDSCEELNKRLHDVKTSREAKTTPPNRKLSKVQKMRSEKKNRDTDDSENEEEMQKRFNALSVRLNKSLNSGKVSRESYREDKTCANDVTAAYPSMGISITNPQDVNPDLGHASSSSSSISSAMNLYRSSDEHQRLLVGSYSKNAKISARVPYPHLDLGHGVDNVRIGGRMRSTNHQLFDQVDPFIRERQFDFYSADHHRGREVVIGRPKLTTVNYKVGDSIRFTLHDPYMENAAYARNKIRTEPYSRNIEQNMSCKHCHCCQFRNMGESRNNRAVSTSISPSLSSNKMEKDVKEKEDKRKTIIDRNDDVPGTSWRDEERESSHWNAFAQLKKATMQWREIAKRYVPKSNVEFWDTLKHDIPEPSTADTITPKLVEEELATEVRRQSTKAVLKPKSLKVKRSQSSRSKDYSNSQSTGATSSEETESESAEEDSEDEEEDSSSEEESSGSAPFPSGATRAWDRPESSIWTYSSQLRTKEWDMNDVYKLSENNSNISFYSEDNKDIIYV